MGSGPEPKVQKSVLVDNPSVREDLMCHKKIGGK